jgi:hypothetical protein
LKFQANQVLKVLDKSNSKNFDFAPYLEGLVTCIALSLNNIAMYFNLQDDLLSLPKSYYNDNKTFSGKYWVGAI